MNIEELKTNLNEALELIESASNYVKGAMTFTLNSDNYHRSDDDQDYATACADIIIDLTHAYMDDDETMLARAMHAYRTCSDDFTELFPTTGTECIHMTAFPFIANDDCPND